MAAFTNAPRIDMVPHGSIHPNPKNPRRHGPKQQNQIEASLRRFGFKGALIVDEAGMILAGNALWAAAGKLGMDEVPVIRASFASKADARAFLLAHNKLAEHASWDSAIVEAELKSLFDSGYAFEVTGFSTNDLDFAIVTKPDAAGDASEPPDPNAQAVSRTGDLWHIGPHRLLCGSSLDVASFELVLGGEQADMVFSDPPFGVPIENNVSGLGKTRHREFAMMSGEQTPAELTAFFRRIFRNCVQFSRAASIHYSCIDWRHVREMIDAADGVYTEFKQLIVWDKGAGAMGAFYRSQHELICVFKSGRGRHVNNFELGRQRYRTNIWRYDGAAQFRKGRKEDLAAHPTVKSTALVIDAIRDCSATGDLILDPFTGSGTTAVAGYHTQRRCATIEIDPLYVDVAVGRLCKVTGERAIHADGRTFDEIAAERAETRNV